MAKVQQRFLIAAGTLTVCLLPIPIASAKKFYDDDPIRQMPGPMAVQKAAPRKLSDLYDFFYMSFGKPGEKHRPGAPVPAGGTNTLGEVPDSNWYTNRHGVRRMSIEELVRGPGNASSPTPGEPLRVVSAKTEGVTPGFTIKDSRGRRYQVKFDAPANFELSTGADVMGSKFFHALGYFTPENYIFYFNPEQLVVEPGTRMVDYRGVERPMRQSDITGVLERVPRTNDGRIRAVASLFLSGKPLGPFRYHGMRTDDPNDIVPHEHRRDLRGLKVFSAWLNHSDTKSLNSLDMLVEENGTSHIRHHLIDFSAAIGSDAFEPKSPRAGHVFMLDWPDAVKTFFSLGLYAPDWTRAEYEHVRGMGRMESEVFDPDAWKSHYYNPAFANCLPDDGFWAAKQVMRFTEPEIRAIVETAQYSDKAAVDHLVSVLVQRQRRIGQEYFSRVLPLDNFRVAGGQLEYEDLGVTYGFMRTARTYQVSWSVFDNETGGSAPIAGATSWALPRSEARYLAASIRAEDPSLTLTVYVRQRAGGAEMAGIERGWKNTNHAPSVRREEAVSRALTR